MNNKIKNIAVCITAGVFVFGLALLFIFLPKSGYSDSERRELAKFPELSLSTVINAKFMSEFEDYGLDNFPFRETFRSLKAATAKYVFSQLDVNDIFVTEEGYAAKVEYPLKESSLDYAVSRFQHVYNKYLANSGSKIYYSIVPDKNYFAADGVRLKMDYNEFVSLFCNKMTFGEYIDIFPELSLEDYYLTDTHWKQECIVGVAEKLAAAMGVELTGEFTENTVDYPFYGVYKGQSALPMKADTIKYLTSDAINRAEVFNFETSQNMGMYNEEKLTSRDPYEYYLSGSLSLVSIKDPAATTDRKLIVFRDSFGSSLAPLFTGAYSEIIVIDIRYILPDFLGNFVNFENSDVLFIYSTSVLNNSETIK